MKTKFTKGEWIVDYGHTIGHIKAVTIGYERTPTVAIYNHRTRLLNQEPTEEELANAKLIAASPKMFEELVLLKEQVSRVATGYPPVDYQLEQWIKRVNELIKEVTE